MLWCVFFLGIKPCGPPPPPAPPHRPAAITLLFLHASLIGDEYESILFDIWQNSARKHAFALRWITTPSAVIKLILFGFHKYDPWLLVVSGGGEEWWLRAAGGGHPAADTWNDWESAACSYYLVPCIVIITPALSAPLLPSLLAIVIVIDWCGGQNSTVWKGIRHTSHNCPAIWSPPPPPPPSPPSYRLLRLCVPPGLKFISVFVPARQMGDGSRGEKDNVCTCTQILTGACYSYPTWIDLITVCVWMMHRLIRTCIQLCSEMCRDIQAGVKFSQPWLESSNVALGHRFFFVLFLDLY